jgi:hypothetical protein
MGRELRYRVAGEGKLWAVHETVSEIEGAITPEFKTKKELIKHLVAHGTDWDKPWSRVAAEDFVNRTGWAPSFILSKGGVTKGYEQPGQRPKKGGGDEKETQEDHTD